MRIAVGGYLARPQSPREDGHSITRSRSDKKQRHVKDQLTLREGSGCDVNNPVMAKCQPLTVTKKILRRAGGDRTHDRGIMSWEQTVGMVR